MDPCTLAYTFAIRQIGLLRSSSILQDLPRDSAAQGLGETPWIPVLGGSLEGVISEFRIAAKSH